MDNHWTGRKHTKETLQKMRKLSIWHNVEKIVQLYNSNKSTQEIAKVYNCNPCTIGRLLKKNGVQLRKGGNRKGFIPWNKGKPYYAIRGEKNPRWKGGITNLNQQIRHCIEYKNWIKQIFERDDWTCQKCSKRGGNIEADHYPKEFSKILKDNNITSYKDAQECSILWDIKNGRTLCLKCHNRTKQVRSRFKKVCSNKL